MRSTMGFRSCLGGGQIKAVDEAVWAGGGGCAVAPIFFCAATVPGCSPWRGRRPPSRRVCVPVGRAPTRALSVKKWRSWCQRQIEPPAARGCAGTAAVRGAAGGRVDLKADEVLGIGCKTLKSGFGKKACAASRRARRATGRDHTLGAADPRPDGVPSSATPCSRSPGSTYVSVRGIPCRATPTIRRIPPFFVPDPRPSRSPKRPSRSR